MSGSTARKAAPRKATPAKPTAGRARPRRASAQPFIPDPPPDPEADEAVAQRIALFDELRARAGDSPGIVPRGVSEPYVLGPEAGFDPPLVARFPDDLELKLELEVATRRGDQLGGLNIMLGDEGLLRVVRLFKQFQDGDKLLVGLYLRLQDHFLGRGAAEVGGTPAS